MQQESCAVENRFSDLARGAALVRALAARDAREEIRGTDSMAEGFLAADRKNSLDDQKIREWLISNYIPRGVYPYTIARTAYFDNIFQQGLRDKIPQVVIIGAGYDSRPYRFADLAADTVIFELDDAVVQKQKQEALQRMGVELPANVRYVPTGYDTESLKRGLIEAGYDSGLQTLFLWEGASYHLTTEEVDKTIRLLAANSPEGSTLCFDYNTVAPRDQEGDLGRDLAEFFGSSSAGNNDLFSVEEGKTGVFLAERDFLILENLTASEMEKRFLTLKDGSLAGGVPERHNIAYASLTK